MLRDDPPEATLCKPTMWYRHWLPTRRFSQCHKRVDHCMVGKRDLLKPYAILIAPDAIEMENRSISPQGDESDLQRIFVILIFSLDKAWPRKGSRFLVACYVCIDPLGIVVPCSEFALSNCSCVTMAPLSLAPLRSAPLRSASLKSASLKSAPMKSA